MRQSFSFDVIGHIGIFQRTGNGRALIPPWPAHAHFCLLSPEGIVWTRRTGAGTPAYGQLQGERHLGSLSDGRWRPWFPDQPWYIPPTMSFVLGLALGGLPENLDSLDKAQATLLGLLPLPSIHSLSGLPSFSLSGGVLASSPISTSSLTRHLASMKFLPSSHDVTRASLTLGCRRMANSPAYRLSPDSGSHPLLAPLLLKWFAWFFPARIFQIRILAYLDEAATLALLPRSS